MNESKKKFNLKDLTKLRLKKSFVGLFFVILSVLSYQIFYLFITFIILSLIFSILGFFDKKVSSIIISIVVILLSIGSTLFYYLYYKPNYVDPNVGKNILIGTWEYNDIGGTYVLNEDHTYYQYVSSDKKDNYCTGRYKYSFGYEDSEAGTMLLTDPDFIYYTLTLNPSKCMVEGKIDASSETKYAKIMMFMYSKGINSNTKSIIINTNTDNSYKLNKLD